MHKKEKPATERDIVFWASMTIALLTQNPAATFGFGAMALVIAAQDLRRALKEYRANREQLAKENKK